jgi:hypothetical protein
MDKLKICIEALRVLARQANDPNAQPLAERRINEYLREEVDALTASLERISKAIDAEADRNVPGEDWGLMQDYARWCRERLAIRGE